MDGDTGLEVGAELTSAEKPNKNLGDFVNKKKEKPTKWKYTSRVDELTKADKITDDRDIQDKEFGEAWNDGNKMIKYIDKYGDHPKKISDQIKKDRHPLLPTTDTVKQLENLKSLKELNGIPENLEKSRSEEKKIQSIKKHFKQYLVKLIKL